MSSPRVAALFCAALCLMKTVKAEDSLPSDSQTTREIAIMYILCFVGVFCLIPLWELVKKCCPGLVGHKTEEDHDDDGPKDQDAL